MNQYRLSNEWQGRKLIGSSLADAVMRVKWLDRPRTVVRGEGGRPVGMSGGERVEIAKILRADHDAPYQRGSSTPLRIIALMADGAILEIDAQIYERDIC